MNLSPERRSYIFAEKAGHGFLLDVAYTVKEADVLFHDEKFDLLILDPGITSRAATGGVTGEMAKDCSPEQIKRQDINNSIGKH